MKPADVPTGSTQVAIEDVGSAEYVVERARSGDLNRASHFPRSRGRRASSGG